MSPSRSLLIVLGLLLALGGPLLACRAAPQSSYARGSYPSSPDDDPDAQPYLLDQRWRTGTLPGSPAWTGPAHPGGEAGLYAYTDPGQLPELRDAAGNPLPLRHTAMHAQLRGHVAAVQVWQRFHNASTDPIEVVYRFPLPENSAVSDLRMIIGDRVINSDIMRLEDARETFEGARVAGHTAALLEQERPNLFTQSVTNIAPGEDVVVEIRYLQTLTYDAGEYELVFPLVVGPRFVPPDASVPDEARISLPIAGPGVRTGHDVTIEVDAQAGPPILAVTSPTHEVATTLDGGRLHATLVAKDELPNRDFVLRYRVAGPRPSASVLLGEPDSSGLGHYLMVVHPPAVDVDAEVGRREVIFVVDRSGSMAGPPLGLAKETVRELLTHLRPVDTFDVVGFASGTERLFGQPRPANASNLVQALRFIDGMEGGGGTMMDDAVREAFTDAVAPGLGRYVLLLSDGWVGNETQLFESAQTMVRDLAKRGGVGRVFGLGIGAAPNRYLIDGIATAGNGVARDISTREHPRRAVDAIMHDIDRPALTGLAFAEGSPLRVEHFPAVLPDLFVSQPVVVMGRYRGPVGSTVTLHGQRGGVPVRLDVPVHRIEDAGPLLQTLWARAKIEDLGAALWQSTEQETTDQVTATITALGLRYRLVTPYTAFVAVDGSRTIGTGHPDRVLQPIALPEGVSISATPGRHFSHGISLAGTTGAESKYVVEGASVNDPSFGTVGTSIVQEYVALEEMERRVARPPGVVQVHVMIGRPEHEGPGLRRALRAAVRERREHLRRCVISSPLYEEEGVRVLSVELALDEHGNARVTVREGSLGHAKADACIEHALHPVAATLERGTTVTIPLRVGAG